PHQQQHRSKGGNTIPCHPYFCAAAGGGSAFRAGFLTSSHYTELSSSLLLFEGELKLKPNRDPVAEVFPNVNGFDFSLLKMLLTDSEPNTNFGGETTVFVGVSEVLDTSETSTVTSEIFISPMPLSFH
uniref:Uncharacterized protein n=1 Tax=Chrysemys picta bellii TaxID=8478 RepID=A0A8C3FMS5_CHRPI